MGEPAKNCVCEECKMGLVNLPTGLGAVCPDGHGGVVDAIPKEASRSNVRAAKVATLPGAILVATIVAAAKGSFADKCLYRVEDPTAMGVMRNGVYRRVVRASSSLDKHDDKSVLVNLRGKAVELVPWSW